MPLATFQRIRREKAKKEAILKQESKQSEVLLKELTLPQLKEKAKALGLTGYSKLKEDELIALIEGVNND